MSELEQLMAEHTDLELHVITDPKPFIAVLRKDGGDVCSAEANSIEGALTLLGEKAVLAFEVFS